MPAQVLTTPPLAGEFPEVHFSEHFQFQTWVKFTTNEGDEWVGCFPMQYAQSKCSVVVDVYNIRAFVTAGGCGYLIDINTRGLLCKLDEHPIVESAISTSNPDYFVLGACYLVYVIDENNQVRTIDPDFIVDGIYFKEQKDTKVLGELDTAENQYSERVPCELELLSLAFRMTRS